MIVEDLYYRMLKWFNNNHPDEMHRFIASISENQYHCKEWLVDSLDRVGHMIPRDENHQFKVEIIGGWFGFPLLEMLILRWGSSIKEIDFYEIDPFACKVLTVYLKMWDVDFRNIRIFNEDYFKSHESNTDGLQSDSPVLYEKQFRRAHLIINTSCEHMEDMKVMKKAYEFPERTMLVLQSNDKDDEDDHINCVVDMDELAEQAGIRQLYGDTKVLKSKDKDVLTWWNRFMVMGKWD
ncbi:MAG: hypothetical protein CMD98_06355 [Gammaproteobacteria bacterium]|nr:hypothetical protein [Gammaproteobacteria bacterium]|tara:strand:+ start:4431 stop:5141 length:711 start_codon:yes stop_codon:yes gene_type:complete